MAHVSQVQCCFASTETVGLLGTGAQDGHLDFHTAPEIWPGADDEDVALCVSPRAGNYGFLFLLFCGPFNFFSFFFFAYFLVVQSGVKREH